jgi:hypothetical protein
LAFERRLTVPSGRSVPGEQLLIWRGLGTGNAFSEYSERNMR